jgi:hypothetical protein
MGLGEHLCSQEAKCRLYEFSNSALLRFYLLGLIQILKEPG